MIDLTGHPVGVISLVLFAAAYLAVMAEEFTHLRKSKPVLLAAGLIWVMIAWVGRGQGLSEAVNAAVRHNILEFAELFLFLLVAMTYINALDERRVFEALRCRLVGLGLSYRRIFWLTGAIAFCISPIADNLTTALFMCAVILSIGRTKPRFVLLGCINLVVAANAGGAFSPFGDITTLMVWQKGIVDFWTFFALFLPALVNWLVPAAIMSFSVPTGVPVAAEEQVGMKRGAVIIMVMFAVLSMRPEMSVGQWLLVTLTAGVGGSLLSIGSAAGVGLMGQARGQYTFVGHLKWAPLIALGYAASIAVHFLVNAGRFWGTGAAGNSPRRVEFSPLHRYHVA